MRPTRLDGMTSTTSPHAGTIVVGVDGSRESEHAVIWAAEEAHLQHRGLTLVHAQKLIGARQMAWFATAGIPTTQITDRMHEDMQGILERARSLALDHLVTDVVTLPHAGDARGVLLELAEGAPMVVVGSRGHGRVVGLLLGSVSGALVRHAPCPVAVVRPTSERRRGILVGVDTSEAASAPLEFAYAEASARGRPLNVVHCLWDALVGQPHWAPVSCSDPAYEQAQLCLAESLAGMAEKYPDVPVTLSITRGAIDACLVDLSQQYDLLVLGRPPHSLGERMVLPGLVVTVAEQAHAPVLVIP
jgi:nucleotide-binding universal stress UspA family protein